MLFSGFSSPLILASSVEHKTTLSVSPLVSVHLHHSFQLWLVLSRISWYLNRVPRQEQHGFAEPLIDSHYLNPPDVITHGIAACMRILNTLSID